MSDVQTRRVHDVSVPERPRIEGLQVESSGSGCNFPDHVVLEMKVHLNDKVEAERDCRICQLDLDAEMTECGVAIQLGCSCKGDLGSAHKQCAETWFKIKGDTICEICGVTAVNMRTSERMNEANVVTVMAPSGPTAPLVLVETIWHGRRIMNFLLACMVLAFITSWLFHFKIL